jgi:hypothetical protein
MTYSEAWIKEAEKDPVKARQYFWCVAMHNKRLAAQYRRIAQRREGNTTDFDISELPDKARHCENLSKVILENLDDLVKSTVKNTFSKIHSAI